MKGSTYPGGVFSAELPGGRAGASLRLVDAGIEARTADEQSFLLGWDGLQCEMGGASGRMLFLRNADRSLTFFSEDRELVLDLGSAAPPTVAAQVQQVVTFARAGRNRGCGCWLLVLAVLIASLFAAPSCLKAGAAAAVDAMPTSLDKKLGDVSWGSMGGGLQRYDDETVVAALAAMLERLESALSEEDRAADWDFRIAVIRSDELNAFALPGGQMAFYTKLIAQAESPDEVAGVLAHEMAHVLRRHGLKRMVQSVGVVVALQVVIGDYGGLVGMAAQLLTLATINDYSREHESEADAVSVELMHRAGLDPVAMTAMFERMEKEGMSLPSFAEVLNTHPSHATRIADIRRLAAALPAVERRPLPIDWDAVRSSLARLHLPGKDADQPSTTPVEQETGEHGR